MKHMKDPNCRIKPKLKVVNGILQDVNMIRCPACHEMIHIHEAACIHCGHSVRNSTHLICADCGHVHRSPECCAAYNGKKEGEKS